jgi:polar amino acid transport system substrate-binding protein
MPFFSRAGRRALAVAFLLGLSAAPSLAQVTIPNYWDPRRRIERPNLSGVATPIRFLTAHDHPPFNFLGADGQLTGFHVELARAACTELGLACTIQARAFDQLLPLLRENRVDAVIAGHAITADIRRDFEVGDVYLRSPARFVARRGAGLPAPDPVAFAGKRVAVVAGTAHAVFLETFFPEARLLPFPDAGAARAALQRGDADAVFGDAVGLAFWINGSSSANCCAFHGGVYGESRFFGDGYAIVFRSGAEAVRRAFDHALQRLAERGTYAELYLRWFPVGLY